MKKNPTAELDLESLLQQLLACPRSIITERAIRPSPLAVEWELEQHMRNHPSEVRDGFLCFPISKYMTDFYPDHTDLAKVENLICFDANSASLAFHLSPSPPAPSCASRIFLSSGLFLPTAYEDAIDKLVYQQRYTLNDLLIGAHEEMGDQIDLDPEVNLLTADNLKKLLHRWIITKQVASRHLRLLESGWLPYPQLPTIELLQQVPVLEPLVHSLPGLFQMLLELHIQQRKDGHSAVPLLRSLAGDPQIATMLAAVGFDANALSVQTLRSWVPHYLNRRPLADFLDSLIESAKQRPLPLQINQLPTGDRPLLWLANRRKEAITLPTHILRQLHLCEHLRINPSCPGPYLQLTDHPCLLQLYAAPAFAELAVRTGMGNYPPCQLPLHQLREDPDQHLWQHVLEQEPILSTYLAGGVDPSAQKARLLQLLDRVDLPPTALRALYLLNDADLMRKLLLHPALPLQLAQLLANLYPVEALNSPVILFNTLYGSDSEALDDSDRYLYSLQCYLPNEDDPGAERVFVSDAMDFVQICNTSLLTQLVAHRPQRQLIARALFSHKFPEIWQFLAEDIDPVVRCNLALNPFLPPAIARILARDTDACVASLLANQNQPVMDVVLPILIRRDQPEILEAIAANHSLTAAQVDTLPVPDLSIAWHLHHHPNLSPAKAAELYRVHGYTHDIHQRCASKEIPHPLISRSLKILR